MSAVQVVSIDAATHEFTLHARELERILLRHECADLPVAVVSVAGPFRLGKSFLLNFFLRCPPSPSSPLHPPHPPQVP